MRPDELHAEVLAALGAAGGAVADSTGGPWHVGDAVDPTTPCNLHSAQDGRGVADGVSWLDAHLIGALRNTAAAAYRGARRIIERHAPMRSGHCDTCWGRRRADTGWPCADYRDAAAVIPHLPKEAADALRR